MHRKYIYNHWLLALFTVWRYGNVESRLPFDMLPIGDVYLPSDSDLELQCSITNASINASLISIDTNFDYNGTCGIRVCDRVRVQHFTNDTGFRQLSLIIPNVTVEDSNLYYCHYGDPPSWESFKSVEIRDVPSRPTNLSCLSYNFENLQCMANFILAPTDIPMEWTLIYRISSTDGEVNCSHAPTNNSITCLSFNISEGFYNYSIELSLIGANTEYNVSIERTSQIMNDFSIVKPNPVSNVRLRHINGSEIILFWEITIFAPNLDLIQRLKLVSLNNWTKPSVQDIHISNKTLPKGPASFSHRYSGLVPNGRYLVSIQWKSESAAGEQFWSGPTELKFTTQIAIPGQSVVMTNGSFLYQASDEGNTTVVLYWQNPDDRYSHGNITKYMIEIRRESIEELLSKSETITEKLRANALVDGGPEVLRQEITGRRDVVVLDNVLTGTSAYMVRVWAGNRAGYSGVYTEVRIPDWKTVQQIRASWVVVERDIARDRTLVSWKVPDAHNTDYIQATVYSCLNHGSTDYVHCKNFSWNKVNASQAVLWIATSQDYSFAVSLETINGISSGMVWQNRTYIYDRVSEIPTYTVNAEPVNHNVLNVTIIHGDSTGGKPQIYKIVLKEVTKEDDPSKCPKGVSPLEHEVDFGRSDILLSGLKAGTEYIVCVSAVNNIGESLMGVPAVMKTSSQHVTLKEVDNSLAIGIGIGLAVFVVVVVLLIGALWMRHRLRKSRLENRIETIDVRVDDYEEDDTNKFSSVHLQLLDATDEREDEVGIDDKDSGAESGEPSSPEPVGEQLFTVNNTLPDKNEIKVEVESSGVESMENKSHEQRQPDSEKVEELSESIQWSVFSHSSSSPLLEQDNSGPGLLGYMPTNRCSSSLDVHEDSQVTSSETPTMNDSSVIDNSSLST